MTESHCSILSKLLTIIVPTYNMEQYLDKCLNSVVVNDPGLLEQIEVIVVNDGSKDTSSQIAHSFAIRFPDVFIVIDKENGNYGSCINVALCVATGKYVKILDADDYFDKEQFEYYLKDLCSVDADLIVCKKTTVDIKGEVIQRHSVDLKTHNVLDFQEVSGNMQVLDMHKMAYRRTMLLDIQYRQSEGVSYSDIEWTIMPFSRVEKVIFLPYDVYQYLQGREGQTVDRTVKSKSLASMRVILLSLGDYLNSFHGSQIRKLFVFDKFVFNVLYLYREFFFKGYYGTEEFRKLDSELISRFPEIKQYIDNHQWVSFIPNLHLASDWRDKRTVRFVLEYSLIKFYLFLSGKQY